MSFYQVLRSKYPDKKESEIAEIIGRPVMTLRNWKHQEPRASMILDVAENLGMEPEELFSEFVRDLKSHEEGEQERCQGK